jgi:uncharacterized ion transporter superfamily protein YfcC
MDAANLLFYLMMIGGFFHSLNNTGALEAGLGSIIKKTNGKELLLVPIIMLIFSLPGTI